MVNVVLAITARGRRSPRDAGPFWSNCTGGLAYESAFYSAFSFGSFFFHATCMLPAVFWFLETSLVCIELVLFGIARGDSGMAFLFFSLSLFFASQFWHVGTGPCSFLIRVELILYDLICFGI